MRKAVLIPVVAAMFWTCTVHSADSVVRSPASPCWELRRHGRYDEARSCFSDLLRSGKPAERAEGYWGLHQYESANLQFREALGGDQANNDIRIRWGTFLHERYSDEDATGLFNEVLKTDKDNARAYLGLARVASDGYEDKAIEFARKALAKDPHIIEAQELLSFLALEDADQERAIEEANKALKMSNDALDAMSVLAAVEVLRDKSPDPWLQKIAAVNPRDGAAYSMLGHFMIVNRRYEEGIQFYQKAIAYEPDLDEARAELGVNLMRLGKEEEARTHLVKAYQNGYRNALTTNSLTLMDSYKNFQTFRSGNTILRLHNKEAEVLRPYIEAELKRAIATYEKKYGMKLDGPVQLEVYPDHDDFAVRTMGLPGLGALGVTFGNIVAMDSPSGRKPGSFHWASTLWHELSHVYILKATNHRVPRWFTEGLAVYEETAVEPDWGDRLDPGVIAAIKSKKLLPIAQLDRGFIRPSYPNQVIVSYFQAGKVCEYIAENWGYKKLIDMVHAFATPVATTEVVEKQLGLKPEEFDAKFLPWLESQTKKQVNGFEVWRKQMGEMSTAEAAKKWDDVITIGKQIEELYPDYVEHNSAYQKMAEAYLAKGDKASAIAELQRYSRIGGRDPEAIKKLASLLTEAGKPAEAATALNRLNYIYPLDADAHRMLGDLWLKTGNPDGAVREFAAVVAEKPLDPAVSRYNLARALRAANRVDEAKDQLIQSLEVAPGYKDAQRMLLEIAK